MYTKQGSRSNSCRTHLPRSTTLRAVPVAALFALAAGVGAGLFEGGLGGGEAGDRYAERAAGDVIQANLLAELDRIRVAAVLAADAAFELVLRTMAFADGHLDELADADGVERLERIAGKDFLLQV